MADCRVRIYRAENFAAESIDVIGASRSATDMFRQPEFWEFMAEHNKDVERLPKGLMPAGGVSSEYWTVRPPLDDEQLKQFGRLCVERIVDAGSNDTYVIDQREVEAVPTLAGDKIIAVG